MKDERKTKAQLIKELDELRSRLSKSEDSKVEREEADEKLDSERKQLLSLFESINEAIYVVDPETYEILFANKFLKDAFGKDLEGGICYREFQGFDEPCDFCTNEIILKQKGKPYTWEYHNPVLDRHYMITDRIIKWPDGRDVRFELAIDITERKKAEEALQSEKAFTEVALNSLVDVFYVLDADGSLLRWNDSFSRVTGYNDEELSCMSVLDFFGGEDLQRQREFYRTLLREGKASFEAEVIVKDGRRIPYYFHSTLLRDVGGNPDIVCGVGRDITEQKRAEEALHESEERYRDLFENASDLIQSVTSQGRFVYVNRAWKETLGYDEEEVKDINMFDIIHPESMEHCMETFGRVMSGEDVKGIEATFVSKDGRKIMVEGSASCRFVDGEPVNTRGIFRDVTERKRIEEEIIKFKSISDNANYGVAIVDMKGSITYINEYFASVHGYKPDDLTGKNLGVFHNDEQMREVIEINQRLQETGSYNAMEVWHVHRDGTAFPMLMNGVIINDKEGNPSFMAATAIDITERKQAEEELRRLSNAVRMSTDSIVLSDTEGKITEVNEATVEMYGAEDENDLIGRNAFDLIADEDRERALVGMAEAIMKGYIEPQEFQVVRQDGTQVPVEMSAAAMKDAKDELIGFVAVSRDISERKQVEEELQLHMQELESFAHSISHDLRGPLALIIGFSQTAKMARERGKEDLERESLDDALRAAMRMDAFIDSLLQYARAGRPQEKAARVEPGGILREVLLDMEGSIQDKDAEVEVEGDLPAVEVDAVKLKQVLFNLLGNAIKFTWEGIGPRIEVGANKKDATVTIYVRDDGLGIPEEKQEAIFEPFKRYSSVEYPGLGIGLSTVKRAVEAWGGRIWVESVPGKGSTFYFTAPAADQ